MPGSCPKWDAPGIGVAAGDRPDKAYSAKRVEAGPLSSEMTRSSPNQGAFLLRPAVALSLVAVLTGCATRPFEAAGDVHALMVAIRNDDHAAFEAHIDRVALKANIQARMIAQARATRLPGVSAVAVLLSGPLAGSVDRGTCSTRCLARRRKLFRLSLQHAYSCGTGDRGHIEVGSRCDGLRFHGKPEVPSGVCSRRGCLAPDRHRPHCSSGRYLTRGRSHHCNNPDSQRRHIEQGGNNSNVFLRSRQR